MRNFKNSFGERPGATKDIYFIFTRILHGLNDGEKTGDECFLECFFQSSDSIWIFIFLTKMILYFGYSLSHRK